MQTLKFMRPSLIVATLFGLALMLTNGSVFAAESRDHHTEKSYRKIVLLNDHWSYLEEDIANVADLKSAATSWKRVELPHTWNRDDVMDLVPGYRRGVGWYRRTIAAPPARNTDRHILCLEGVNMKAEVFVNGRRAGGHVGGYLGFEVDITTFLRRGSSNVIHIKVDNSIDPDVIPSQKSDFFLYGGITRNVWLKIVPATYIGRVKVATHDVSIEKAGTQVEVTVVNTLATRAHAQFDVLILDTSGTRVSQSSLERRIDLGTHTLVVALPDLQRPMLWAPSHPVLYEARVTMRVSRKTVDIANERFGYRWFEFKEHGPFYLNGERLLLRGTHRHEEWSGFGNALPDSLQRREMKMIKDMGANFVRLAHYPQAPEVYRLCDELGLLVWDELPWCRGGVGGAVWKDNTERMLREMIDQNFNHPSIVIWSLGNELDWLPDVPGGDNIDSLRSMLAKLNTIAHTMDPSRATATRRFDEGADLVDVHSPSIWPGWYASNAGYESYEKAITDARRKFRRFFHAEYGGDSHVGRHSENRIGGDGMLVTSRGKEKMMPVATHGDWSESYIVDLFEWYLRVSEQSDSLAGNAQWIFKDFGTPLRPENPIPYVNQKGLCDLAGAPKDAYYLYKSYWTVSPKFCYIESHTWTERSGPENIKRDIKVFANCAQVELFLNGVSQGIRTKDIAKFPASGLLWQVNFAEGANRLLAVGCGQDKGAAQDSLVVRYTYIQNGPADDIQLSSVRLPNSHVLVIAVAVDKNGRHCLDYNKRVYFSLIGSGKLVTGYGTRTSSSLIEMANGRAYVEFVPGRKGESIIEARNQDLKGAYLVIPVGTSLHSSQSETKPRRLRANEN